MSAPKPVSNSILGQFKDEVVGEAKQIAKDTAKTVVTEPKKILESILGGVPSDDKQGETDFEQGNASQDPQQAKMQAQQLLMKKQQDDQDKSQKLLNLHKQRLSEEQEYYERKKREEEAKKQQQEMMEVEQKKQQIMQLKHERAESLQLQTQTYGKQGSREQGKRSY